MFVHGACFGQAMRLLVQRLQNQIGDNNTGQNCSQHSHRQFCLFRIVEVHQLGQQNGKHHKDEASRRHEHGVTDEPAQNRENCLTSDAAQYAGQRRDKDVKGRASFFNSRMHQNHDLTDDLRQFVRHNGTGHNPTAHGIN